MGFIPYCCNTNVGKWAGEPSWITYSEVRNPKKVNVKSDARRPSGVSFISEITVALGRHRHFLQVPYHADVFNGLVEIVVLAVSHD